MVQSTNIKVITKKEKTSISLKEKYLNFCDEQLKNRMLWYLVPLISLTTTIMPISIIAMSYFEGYLAFIGLSMFLFFGNIIFNIAQLHTRYTISIYLLSVIIHFIIPILYFLFSF